MFGIAQAIQNLERSDSESSSSESDSSVRDDLLDDPDYNDDDSNGISVEQVFEQLTDPSVRK